MITIPIGKPYISKFAISMIMRCKPEGPSLDGSSIKLVIPPPPYVCILQITRNFIIALNRPALLASPHSPFQTAAAIPYAPKSSFLRPCRRIHTVFLPYLLGFRLHSIAFRRRLSQCGSFMGLLSGAGWTLVVTQKSPPVENKNTERLQSRPAVPV